MPLNLLDSEVVRTLTRTYGLHPTRDSGQNFLLCPDVLKMSIEAAQLTPHDEVLEIGSGLGTLTVALAGVAKRVVAVESDPATLRALHDTTMAYSNVEIQERSILEKSEQDICSWFTKEYVCVSNIPYSITSRLVRLFFNSYMAVHGPRVIVWLVQKEVAHRMVGENGNYSLLTLAVRRYSTPEIIKNVTRNCFWPEPDVDSSLIRFIPNKREFTHHEEETFWRIARAGFSSRRKQLHHNLANILSLSKKELQDTLFSLELNPLCRAQDLTMESWEKVHILLREYLLSK